MFVQDPAVLDEDGLDACETSRGPLKQPATAAACCANDRVADRARSASRKGRSASRTTLDRAGLTPEQIDVWEIHEAYAAVAVAILRELPEQLHGFQVPDGRLNPNGGAVAIGHPFGSSGTRYVLTLATELRTRGARYGVLGVCVGSGQGVALVLENPSA